MKAASPIYSTAPVLRHGEPVDVRFRFLVEHVGDINTLQSSAWVKVVVGLYWTDSRVIGYEDGQALPDDLWGPLPILTNGMHIEVEPYEFSVVDKSVGRLKRLVRYTGNIVNPMDIRMFPFDVDAVELCFDTYGCTFQTYAQTRKGAMAFTRTYELSPVTDNTREGLNILMRWNLELAGWHCFGWSFSTKPYTTAAGAPNNAIKFTILMSRYSWYYMPKVVLPFIAMIIIVTLGHCGDYKEFYDRLAFVSTMFLANVAVLLVIENHLPKTNFITYAEQLAIVATSLTAVDCVLVSVAYVIHLRGHDDAAFWFDKISGAVMAVCFLGYMYVNLFHGKLDKQRRQMKALKDFHLPDGFLQVFEKTNGVLQFYGSVNAEAGEQHHEIHLRTPIYEHQHEYLQKYLATSGVPCGECKLRNSTDLFKEK